MPKKILIIESDAALAASIAAALYARGAEVALARDAGSAVDAARGARPDGIVLCAELPGGSGFVVCNKLRKEADLRAIPLLLTSAAASEETFEQHRKLKTRADGYLRKPFAIAALIEQLAPLAGLADAAPGAPDDDDLLAFDAAFDSIAQVDASGPIDHPISSDEVEAAAALVADLPDVEVDERPPPRAVPRAEAAAPLATASVDATGRIDPEVFSEVAAEVAANIDAEVAAEIAAEVAPPAADGAGDAPAADPAELEALRGEVLRLRAELDEARAALTGANAALASANASLEEAHAARAELEARLAAQDGRAREAESQVGARVAAERARVRAALQAALAELDRG
jgi:DNA-binding response OmpR family regulator